jgi:hypothetical protein
MLNQMRRLPLTLLALFISLSLFGAISTVSATPNLGMLRVSSFICPREVMPGANFPVSLDIEYAIQGLPNEATIRGAIYTGDLNSGTLLWQSNPTSVSNGGDQVWNFTLNAPTAEGALDLTAYALFLENGTWNYFDNPVNGPGISHTNVKIAKSANLDIVIGAPDVGVTVNGATNQTSVNGDAIFSVAVGSTPSVSVSRVVELQNSTRIIFTEWSDGATEAQRQVPIDGDISLTALYRTQYLLKISNSSTIEQWYDEGTNITLTAPASTSAPWPMNIFGVTETFQSWSGDIHSSSRRVIITMNSPKTITAVMTTDYRPLALPLIFGFGIATAIISLALVWRRSGTVEQKLPEIPLEEPAPEPEPNPTCSRCGRVTEPEWVHCIGCGTKLKDASPSQAGS